MLIHELNMTELSHFVSKLNGADPEIAAAIAGEHDRQCHQIELIASENFVSNAVLAAQGSVFTNKTVEGYPGKRYYGGAEFADQVESLAIERACRLFNCAYANVQPHSGSNANQAVYLALLKQGDVILSMDIASGGHISHGHPATLTGRDYRIVPYGVTRDAGLIDYDSVEALVEQHRPKMIIAGGSAYPRAIDFERLRTIAGKVGAYLLADIAHIAGLVVTGMHPNPFPHAHIVTTTTYKSLRGARGGMILADDEKLGKKINKAVFPGVQGSVLLHGVAAKAVCLGEALKSEFKCYSQMVIDNAQVLVKTLSDAGVGLVSDGTDTGMLLVDLRSKGLTGDVAVNSLEAAGLTCNKNLIPFDPQPAEIASGLRLSTNAGTTRGFGEQEFSQIGRWIAQVLDGLSQDNTVNEQIEQRVRGEVKELCDRFPFYSA